MKKSFLLFSFFAFTGFIFAQAPAYQWARTWGSPANDDGAKGVAVDTAGNVYTTGYFSGTVDFNPGTGVFNLTSAGQTDIYISKLNASGNFVWAKRIGGTDGDAGWSIALDNTGNVIVGGTYTGTVDFDPGAGITTLAGSGNEDAFILKLDPSGNFVWAKSQATPYSDFTWSVAADEFGNAYMCGTYNHAAFFSKLDASGNFAWTESLSSDQTTDAIAITTDSAANVYITGHYQGTTDLDPGPGVSSFSIDPGAYNTFVIKLAPSGNFTWGKSLGDGAADVTPQAIAVDRSGNVYTTGTIAGGSGDFDPGPGVYTLTTTGGSDDSYISKLDASGNFAWAQNIAGLYADVGRGITTDYAGNVYATGNFGGVADFDAGPAVNSMSAGSGLGVYILKLSSTGNFLWVRGIGTSGTNDAFCIAVDAAKNIYTAGSFQATCDFDPGPGTAAITANASSTDSYIQKLAQNANGVEEARAETSLLMYPNPANDELYVLLAAPVSPEQARIELYNVLGERIMAQQAQNGQNRVDMAGRPSGIYFVKVMNGGMLTGTRKIIKQ